MKIGYKPTTLSVEDAQAQLEAAVSRFIKRTYWHSGLNSAGPQYCAKLNELREPLLALKIARKRLEKE